MKMYQKFFLIGLFASGVALSHLGSAMAQGVRVDGPGSVLIVDGTAGNLGVATFEIDATIPVPRYDFGFVDGSGFNQLTSGSLSGFYTFAGGTLVDFALRDTQTGSIYNITNAADYADQLYFNPIDPSHSVTPSVAFPYYNTLVLEWDLDSNGFNPLLDAGITLTQAFDTFDGMAPTAVTPVPLPAAAWLFGSGLVGLVGAVRKRVIA